MPSQPAYEDDRATAVSYPEIRPVAPWRVAEVEALPGWRLRVRHNDGVAGTVDLSGLVPSPGAGVFAALKDVALFGQVHLDLGAVTWPGEIDLSPFTMHDALAEGGEWILN